MPSLDRFVVGSCNRLAREAARRVVEAPGSALRTLFVYGDVGLGKSHLLQGLYAALCRRHPHLRACYVTAEQFTNEFLAALRARSLPSFRQKYRRLAALLVDDVHFLGAKKATQEEFLHTFNEIEARGGQIVLAAERHPRLMRQVSDELTSRFQAGMVCRIDAPDYETRVAILKATGRGPSREVQGGERRVQGETPSTLDPRPSTLWEAAARYVAEHTKTNVRELRGAWNYVCAVAEVSRQPLSAEIARRALAEVAARPACMVRLEDVERAVCGMFGLEPKLLKSRSRTRALTRPRMLAMYLARKHTSAAYSEIGTYFGGRDHSTVISAERKVRKWLESPCTEPEGGWDPREFVEAIQRQLKAS